MVLLRTKPAAKHPAKIVSIERPDICGLQGVEGCWTERLIDAQAIARLVDSPDANCEGNLYPFHDRLVPVADPATELPSPRDQLLAGLTELPDVCESSLDRIEGSIYIDSLH